MKYLTETGSLYEIDEPNKKIRRLSGLKAPTLRQGKDGDWKDYHQIFITEANQLLIDWAGEGKCTYTSRIIRVIEDN